MSAPVPVPGVYRTNDPTQFTQLDGVYIDERRPPGRIRGIANNVVCVVGEFERGPVDQIVQISSTQELLRTFGGWGPDATGAAYKGYLAVHPATKRFDSLRIIRISNTTQALATKNFNDSGATAVLKVDAKWKGYWGTRIKASVQAASSGVANDFNLVISYSGETVEIFRNLNLSQVADDGAFPIVSDYVVVSRIVIGSGRPADAAATSLVGGSDGTFADADYTGGPAAKGIELLKGTEAGAIRIVVVAEKQSAAIKAALLALCEQTRTKIAVVSTDALSDAKSVALTDVALYRSDRVLYVYGAVQAYMAEANSGAGGMVTVSPTSFFASGLAALPPHESVAGPNGEPYFYGIRALVDKTLAVDDFRTFARSGICAFAFSAERQKFGIKSGVTSSLDSAKTLILRRRMADYIQESVAVELTSFQNKTLNRENKLLIKAAIEGFLNEQIRLGILPSEADISKTDDGQPLRPYLVDIESANTAQSEAGGLFVVLLMVRIFPEMRFIVLRTEIGEGVEIRTSDV